MGTNKIKQKYLNKLAVLYGTYCLAGLLAMCVVIHTTQSPNKDTETARTTNNILYSISIAAVSLMFMWVMLTNNKRANKFAIHATQNYIKTTIANNPELKSFESVITDKYAMQKIATVVSNQLRPSEQQDILNIVDVIDRTEKISHRDLDIAYKNIQKTIENHVRFHPEFMPIITSELLSADYLAYVKKQQAKNRDLIQGKTK